MTEKTVVLHGATGTQGRAVLDRLRAAGHHVRAVARRPAAYADPAVEAVTADLLDRAALSAAYTGADVVVVQLPLTFGADAVRQADTVLAALAAAGVPRVVFNTGAGIPPADPVGVPFVDARTRLAGRLPNTVASAAVVGPATTYLENLSSAWSRPVVLGRAELCYPLPADLPNPWVAAGDLGAVVADLVVTADPPAARLVAGPADPTGPEVAAALAAAVGRPVRWRTVTAAEYARMLTPHLGAEAATGIAGAYAAGPAPRPDPALVVRGSTTVREWAARQDWTT